MAIVIDASVALKWVLKEDDSEQARALAASETMIAPDFWLVECANVLAMRVRRGNITVDGADQALDVILAAPVNVVPARAYIASASLGDRAQQKRL